MAVAVFLIGHHKHQQLPKIKFLEFELSGSHKDGTDCLDIRFCMGYSSHLRVVNTLRSASQKRHRLESHLLTKRIKEQRLLPDRAQVLYPIELPRHA